MAQNNMTYQDAENFLMSEIFAPVFFEKLASDYGVRPTTEQEARELLILAGKLQQLQEVQQTKQANERTNLVSQASTLLDQVMGANGLPVTSSGADYSDVEIKEAASRLSQVPHIRDAALLYQDAMRQLMSQ